MQKGQHYTGSWHAGRTILQEEGPLGLYRGFIPALATYGPYVGIYFALYERGRLALKQDNAGLLSNLGVDLFCGALSAAAAAGLTCPLVFALFVYLFQGCREDKNSDPDC